MRKIQCPFAPQPGIRPPSTPGPPTTAGQALIFSGTGEPQRVPTLALLNHSSGLDVGTGSPAEILREGELTQSLLLLYFNNFDDIHVMLDQTSFMRQFALGNVRKALLYAMMALGIRYTQAPFEKPHLRAHWGEPLFNEARNLLKDEFDHPSVINAQIYILLATYHFTFGGTRKAWLSLGFARTIMNLLQIDQSPPETDPYQDEMSRRLIATIGLMENLFTPSVNITRGLSPISPLPTLYSEEDFNMIKTRASVPPESQRKPVVMNEILHLSEILFSICQAWPSLSDDAVNNFSNRRERWETALPRDLQHTRANMKVHWEKFQLRPFAFLHLIHNHILQLLLFKRLTWPPVPYPAEYCCDDDVARAHDAARNIKEIIGDLRDMANCDLHNACFAQIATTTVVVLVHKVLSNQNVWERKSAQSDIQTVRQCLARVKDHCRLFNWVVGQIECFLHTCTQREFWEDENTWRPVLYDQLMSLGTNFERLNYETAGQQNFGLLVYSRHLQSQEPEILSRDFCPRG